MFYLSDPFLLNPAGKKPDKKESSQFPRLYKKFRSNFSEEGSVCLPHEPCHTGSLQPQKTGYRLSMAKFISQISSRSSSRSLFPCLIRPE